MKRFILVLTILILSLGLIFSSVAAQERPDQYGGDDKEKSYLVGYKNVDQGHKKAESKGKVKKKYRHIPAAAVKMTPAKARELENDPDILFVEPDGTVEIKETYPPNLVQIKADVVHSSSVTGQGIKIALLDTGIDLNHQDLRVAGGVSFVEVSGGYQEQSVAEEVYSPTGQSVVDSVYSSGGVVVSSYMDDNGHGTHVAGVVAAQLNGIGVVGVAPEAGLYAVKVLDKDGMGSYSQIIEAIDWAIENGMNIVNMSFGGSQPSQALDQAMNNACDRGILLVAAAGNAGEGVQYPARYSSVIAVGAVDLSNKLASFSAAGPELELVAPGVGVESTLPGNGYGIKSGTSVAAPHVAGAAALVWSAKPGLTNVQVRDTLKQGALPLGDAAQYGAGLVDVARSLGIQQDNTISPSEDILKINQFLQENQGMARVAAAHFLASGDSRVRDYSVRVLGEIGELSELPPLNTAAEKDSLEKIREQAWVSIGKIYMRSGDESEKLTILDTLLKSSYSLARDYAVYQLSLMRSEGSRVLAGQVLTLETNPSRKSVLEAVYGNADPGPALSALTYPDQSVNGLVRMLAYNRQGDYQTITAGQSATVSLQLHSAHSRVEVRVYNANNPGYIIDSRTYYSVPADGTVAHTCYTSSSTSPGTYKIWYHYPDNDIYLPDNFDDYFTIYVNAPSGGGGGGGGGSITPDYYEPNNNPPFPGNSPPYYVTDIQTGTYYANIHQRGDIDYYRFIPSGSGTLTLNMTVPSSVDYDVFLRDSSGNYKAGSFNGTGSGEYFTCEVSGGSAYYIQIYSFSGISSSNYSFTFSLTASRATLDLAVNAPNSVNSGQTFFVTATVSNTSSVAAREVSASIVLSQGLQLAPGETAQKGLAQIAAWGTATAAWQVVAGNFPSSANIEFKVSAGAVNANPCDAVKKVTILPGLVLEIIVPEVNLNDKGWYEQNPLEVKVKLTNNSGSFYPVSYLDLTIENPGGVIDVNSPYAFRNDPNWIRIKLVNPFNSLYTGQSGEYTEKIWILKPTIERDIKITAQINHDESAVSAESSIHIPRANINPVVLVPGIFGSWPQGNGLALDPIMMTYENVQDQFRLVGYEDGVTLFTFPYDWRLSNIDNAEKLNEKIIEVLKVAKQAHEGGKQYIDFTKVDIVAHSMGGLLSRAYIQGGNYQSNVDQLITVGTPHRGAPETYQYLEGLDFSEGVKPWVKYQMVYALAEKNGYIDNTVYPAVVTDEKLYQYLHEKVRSLPELLPDYNNNPYLFHTIENRPSMSHPYGGYDNDFLRNLNMNDMSRLAQVLGQQKATSIIGVGNGKTVLSYEVNQKNEGDFKWGYGQIVKTNYNNGDGTVPGDAAELGSGMNNREWDKLDGYPKEMTKHDHLTTQFQHVIVEELTGKLPFKYASFDYKKLPDDPITCAELLCPAEFQLVDPQGRRIGYDPSTGGYVNEISGALYSPHRMEGWPQLIFVPGFQNGDWKVKVFPRDSGGQFTVKVDTYYPESELTQNVFHASGNISAGQQREYDIKLSEKPDTTAPVTQLTATGIQSGGWFTGDVTLTLAATDDSSGVAITQYSLNGGASWQNYTGPVNLSSSGVYVMQYRSQDRAGNLEAAKSLEIKLDKTAPASGISISGQAGIEGWYRGGVTLTLTASDDVSGVAGIEYSLDGGQTWQGYAGPFTLSREGIYAIMHRSRDQAGNVEAYRTGEVKLDITPPSISGAAATSPNASGWYNADVTVHFSASDGLSGIAAVTPNINISTEGAGQPVTGTATDKAGNTATFTVSGINIDKTPPVISGAATVSPNAGGWYNTDVTVHFTATDGLSGLESVTPDVTITAEGANQATGTALDRAGNTASETVSIIKIDKTAPVTTASPATKPNAAGWYNRDAQVTLAAVDNPGGSGVAGSQYSYDGVNWNSYSGPFTVTAEGITDIYYRSTDKADNTEQAKKLTLKIDKTAPVISGGTVTPPNVNGWHNSDVTVHFEAGDDISGIAWLTPDVIVSAEGSAQVVTGTATDQAGNTTTFTVTVNLDKTPPSITGAATTPANVNGWHNADVTVHFTAGDELSGVGTVNPDVTITTEGAGQTTTGSVVDKAGNSATFTVSGINLDKTAPVISGAATTPANANGWYNTDVTVHFTAGDELSGMETVTPDVTITTEGAGQTTTGTAVDRAGNTAVSTVSGINIDKTAPSITGAATTSPNANGWYNTDVTVHFTAGDELSGVETVTPDITITTEGAGQTTTGSVVDKAGNSATFTVSGINLDKTAPVISGAATTPPNANGWYNSDVTVHFTAGDELSGVETVTPDLTITTEGASQSATGTAVDKAGNTISVTVGDINIDKTRPVIAINVPADGGEYLLNANVPADWTAGDTLSGIAKSEGTVPAGHPIDTASVGTKTFNVNAEDNAGNSEAKTHNYFVRYTFSGVLKPVNPDGSSVFKGNVPVKFWIKDANGSFVSNATARLYLAKVTNGIPGLEIDAISTGKANDGNLFRYDSDESQYIFNLNTKDLAAGTWRLRIVLDDGTSKYIDIGIK